MTLQKPHLRDKKGIMNTAFAVEFCCKTKNHTENQSLQKNLVQKKYLYLKLLLFLRK